MMRQRLSDLLTEQLKETNQVVGGFFSRQQRDLLQLTELTNFDTDQLRALARMNPRNANLTSSLRSPNIVPLPFPCTDSRRAPGTADDLLNLRHLSDTPSLTASSSARPMKLHRDSPVRVLSMRSKAVRISSPCSRLTSAGNASWRKR